MLTNTFCSVKQQNGRCLVRGGRGDVEGKAERGVRTFVPGAAAASPDVVVDRGCMNETRSIDGASHARSRLALDQFPIHVLPASGHPTAE